MLFYKTQYASINNTRVPNKKTIVFTASKDINTTKLTIDSLAFNNTTKNSFSIKINAQVTSGKKYWTNNYNININRLDIGSTKYALKTIGN